MPDVDPSSAQLWKVFPPICQLFLCKNDFATALVGDTTYWTFTLAVRLPGLGKVRLVVSFKSAEVTGTSAVLVTNRVDWSAQRILTLSVQRWPIGVSRKGFITQLVQVQPRPKDASLVA